MPDWPRGQVKPLEPLGGIKTLDRTQRQKTKLLQIKIPAALLSRHYQVHFFYFLSIEKEKKILTASPFLILRQEEPLLSISAAPGPASGILAILNLYKCQK